MANSPSTSEIGKRVIDISPYVNVFEVQEGEIFQIIGKIGNGKTYEGNRRALQFLRQGWPVYTTWKMNIPDYYDQRKSFITLFWKLVLFQSTFYRFNYKKNWHFLDIDRPDLVDFLSKLTDCVVFMDEGQDVFDSGEGKGDLKKKKIITRTRHLNKTLFIISQRPQAVYVTARANVSYFYKTVKSWTIFWPFVPYFKVYRTEEVDQNNFPIWEERLPDGTRWTAPLWHRGFARKEIYSMYDSKYLRGTLERSQQLHFEVYKLSTWDKIKAMFCTLWKGKQWGMPKNLDIKPQNDDAELMPTIHKLPTESANI